jgi:hypothetical protein
MEVGQRAKFVFVAAGIFICYFYYGILQVMDMIRIRFPWPPGFGSVFRMRIRILIQKA